MNEKAGRPVAIAETSPPEAVNPPLLAAWWVIVAGGIILGCLTAVFVLHPFTPIFPGGGLDGSWEAVLAVFAAKHARWGVDVIFTYGPAFPITETYFNAQYYVLTLPILLIVSLISGLCVSCLLAAYLGRFDDRSIAIGVLLYALALVAQRQNASWQLSDSFFFALPWIVFLLDLMRPVHNRWIVLALCLGAAMAGLTALSKMSFGLAALPLFALADLRTVLARRWPPLVVIFLASFVVTDLVYGQSLADLFQSLRLQGEVIGGYSSAMALSGSVVELGMFAAAAATLLLAVVWAELVRPQSKVTSVIVVVATALVLFVVFKAGFVRHDNHSLIGWTSLGVIGLLLGLTRLAIRSPRLAATVSAVSLVVLFVLCPAIATEFDEGQTSWRAVAAVWQSWLTEGPPEELAAVARAVTDPTGFAEALSARQRDAWRAIAAMRPLPDLAGTVDIIPSEQSSLLAGHLHFDPRPSFQQYATYTPGLIAANRDFYQSDRSPEWVFFSPESIDERFPAFAEGALWPLLIGRYEPVDRVGDLALLHRRPEPLHVEGDTRVDASAFGHFVAVPDDGPIFATIKVRPNLIGRLANVLFHSPTLLMTVRFGSGEERQYRFVPALGQAGFLISPMVTQSSEFITLFDGSIMPPSRKIVAVRLDATEQALWAFRNEISIAFTPLLVPLTR